MKVAHIIKLVQNTLVSEYTPTFYTPSCFTHMLSSARRLLTLAYYVFKSTTLLHIFHLPADHVSAYIHIYSVIICWYSSSNHLRKCRNITAKGCLCSYKSTGIADRRPSLALGFHLFKFSVHVWCCNCSYKSRKGKI